MSGQGACRTIAVRLSSAARGKWLFEELQERRPQHKEGFEISHAPFQGQVEALCLTGKSS